MSVSAAGLLQAAEGLCRTAALESAAGLLCRTAGRLAQGCHLKMEKDPSANLAKSVCRNWRVCVGRGASVSAAEGLCRTAALEPAAEGFHRVWEKRPQR